MKKIFAKIVSKSAVKEELSKVYVTKEKLVATNSYVLVEVMRECFKGVKAADELNLRVLDMRFENATLLKPAELDLEPKILEVMPVEECTTFPDYQKIMPSDSDLSSQYVEVKLNPINLVLVLQAIADTFQDKNNRVVSLYVPRKVDGQGVPIAGNKPIIVRRDNGSATGVVMPLND